ncbi:unnamed protein product [Paramecium sonneborni]|uniref:Uncharacterized protein n=1 Tax=Paramecium sonneborni TaxID=65129 RepID=A0A8S1QW64_9CILI|nr:unnamed protein product [Paramecium sonneborni]
MQPQIVDDCLHQQLRRIFSFPILSRNNFLLKKFDSSTGYIRLSCLAKENSFRQFLEYQNGLQNLVNVLIQFNYTNWVYDQTFNAVCPIFTKERKQVQILIQKNQVEEFKKFLQELEVKQEWEPMEAIYIPNKDMIKLFIVFETQEDAQYGFSKIQLSKSIYGIQNAKMEEVDYFAKFLSIVTTKQLQFQEQRMNNMRKYDDRNYDEIQNQFQIHQQYQQQSSQYVQQQQQPQQWQQQQTQQQQQQPQQPQQQQQQQTQSQQQQQQPQQQEQQQFYDYQSLDIVSQRLNQIRTKEKIELNFAPLQEQQFQFSFAPIFYPPQTEIPLNQQKLPEQEPIQVENLQEIPYVEQQSQQPEQRQEKETESNKENSVDKNHDKKYDEGGNEQYQKPYYQNRYQQKRRPYNDSHYHQNKYYEKGNNNRKAQQNYNNLEDDLKEFTGYKKYQQRPQKEYYEPKKES